MGKTRGIHALTRSVTATPQTLETKQPSVCVALTFEGLFALTGRGM